jgi:hypothetical protein
MDQKRIVVCGGGIVGCSVAYFLTQFGHVGDARGLFWRGRSSPDRLSLPERRHRRGVARRRGPGLGQGGGIPGPRLERRRPGRSAGQAKFSAPRRGERRAGPEGRGLQEAVHLVRKSSRESCRRKMKDAFVPTGRCPSGRPTWSPTVRRWRPCPAGYPLKVRPSRETLANAKRLFDCSAPLRLSRRPKHDRPGSPLQVDRGPVGGGKRAGRDARPRRSQRRQVRPGGRGEIRQRRRRLSVPLFRFEDGRVVGVSVGDKVRAQP